MMFSSSAPRSVGDIVHPSALPFILVHLGCIAALWTGVTWSALALGVALYWVRMFAVTGGYHRYFSHRAYATSRVFQFVLAFLAQSTGQKSVLWWAAKHRHHHLHSDTEADIHSPRQGGFFHSHIGWIFDRRNDPTDLVKVEDFARFPELRWLHRFEMLPVALLAIVCFLLAGWPGLVVGFCWSTVAVYHATFAINSLAHVHGTRRYVTGDDSRNNLALALMTMGEGWHNNHHAYQSSARQGFRWWEIDGTYYVLKTMAAMRLVWDLKTPPQAVLRNEHRLSSRVLHRTAEQLAACFNPHAIATGIQKDIEPSEVGPLAQALEQSCTVASEALSALPNVPARNDFVLQARALFAHTPSLDEIVDRAREIFFRAVGAHLRPAIA